MIAATDPALSVAPSMIAASSSWVASAVKTAPRPALKSGSSSSAQTAAATDPLVEQGRQIFLSRACIACHAVSNTTAQGRVGPDLTRYALRPTVGAGAYRVRFREVVG